MDPDISVEIELYCRVTTSCLFCLLSWAIFSFRWNYFFRVCTSSPSLFQPLEDCIHSELIPKFLGRDIPGKLERELFSLPCSYRLGLFIPTVTATHHHNCSLSLHTSSPLVDLIAVSQAHDADPCFASYALSYILPNEEFRILPKVFIINSHQTYYLLLNLPVRKGHLIAWLSCLSLKFHGFALHKTAFWDDAV